MSQYNWFDPIVRIRYDDKTAVEEKIIKKMTSYDDNEAEIINLMQQNDINVNMKINDPQKILNSLLFMAINTNKITIVEYLIEKKVDVNLPNDRSYTPLQFCVNCIDDRFDIFDILLTAGADVDKKNKLGETTLSLVCPQIPDYGYCLIEEKCDINSVDNSGRSCLMNLVDHHIEELALKLIDLKCDINVVDDHGNNALSLACEGAMKTIAFKLLDCGAEIIINKAGKSPLDICRFYEQLPIYYISPPLDLYQEIVQKIKSKYHNKITSEIYENQMSIIAESFKRNRGDVKTIDIIVDFI